MNNAIAVRPRATAAKRSQRVITRSSGRRSMDKAVLHLSAPSFSPVRFPLSGRIAPGWRLNRAIFLTLEQESDGTLVLSDALFGIYGLGASLDEAQRDYVTSLLECYQLLEMRASDNERTQSMLRFLQRFLQPERS